VVLDQRPTGRFVADSAGRLPRVPLCLLPTPLVEARRLSAHLGGPRILIKRDDLTGRSAGGNKLRKLEFLLADAIERGCDTVITCGAAQSNHAAQTAVACANLGLECVLVLWAPKREGTIGNLLVDELAGAKVVFIDRWSGTTREQAMEAEALRLSGRTPYIVGVGGSNGLGSVGYALAFHEILDQCEELGIMPAAVVAACGSGGTVGGLLAGATAAAPSVRVVGIDVDADPDLLDDTLRCARDCAKVLGTPSPTEAPDDLLVQGYVGPGYGRPSPEGREAIALALRTEGILLDPVYTGKAMAGLIGMIRSGVFGPSDTVVFVHTGGLPGLFAIGEGLLAV